MSHNIAHQARIDQATACIRDRFESIVDAADDLLDTHDPGCAAGVMIKILQELATEALAGLVSVSAIRTAQARRG